MGISLKFEFILELLTQLEPNFGGMITRLTLSELCLMTPSTSQDGRLSRILFNIGPFGNFIEFFLAHLA